MSPNSQPLIATIYNPHNQSKEALIAGFIARKQKFERLFRDIRDSPMVKPEQNYLIQGIRGMGKTTLLLRLAYEVDNTPELRQHLVPVVFNEEEYGIGSLADVWERTAQYLGETDASFVDLYDTMTQRYGEADYEQQAFQTLIVALQQQNKKLLLLIDNVGDVLKKLDTQEEQRLREVLLTTPELRLIGATSVVIEQVHDYTKPFYEFFKIIHLDGLTQQEAIELFAKLGETYHAEAVQQLIQRQPGRIEAIRRLTGGVIRTMVLLFEIMVENDSGSVFRDLEVLLDRVTPLYKHRMDDLPAQQQKIVAALAQAWDAASAKELAQAVRLESKVVSAQLKQLINSGLVEKVETNTKNHLYRLEERFFNIWYLMRFGRKTDQRILWLVRFFDTMFEGDSEWMHERIDGHLQAIELGKLDPEAALYLTTAFAELVKNEEVEDVLKRKTIIYLSKSGRVDLVNDLSESKYERVNYLLEIEQYQQAIVILEKFNNRSYQNLLDLTTCHLFLNNLDRAREIAIEILLTQSIDHKQMKLKASEFEEEKVSKGSYTTIRMLVSLLIVLGIVVVLFTRYSEVDNMIEINTEDSDIFSSNLKADLSSEVALRYFLINNSSRKVTAYKLISDISHTDSDLDDKQTRTLIAKRIIELWNNKYEELYKLIPLHKSPPLKASHKQKGADVATLFLFLLLAKKQYHTAYNYFAQEEWQLKDRFKPLYYATLFFLKDEYPTEYLRMGPELKETVDDVLTEVAQMAIDYA
ncbi:ATP-binding protein [Spirosoma pollinicola]|uniref:AAA+ ATPase domain-containing protein n=1 Tax=Spirosoma pollinicola TaxID=2057025 RepID=A0A2K8YWL8_9BACT|nr:ATP-binding protein [Spirosoma pollinicola]AUD01984.1 hypothetical protein CWM47_09235 [Spirosoma pollinicola]